MRFACLDPRPQQQRPNSYRERYAERSHLPRQPVSKTSIPLHPLYLSPHVRRWQIRRHRLPGTTTRRPAELDPGLCYRADGSATLRLEFPMLKSAARPATAYECDPLGAILGAEGGATLWARQGSVCAERGDLVGALRCFQRSLEANLDCLEAWAGLSDVFDRMHDRRRADACLDIAR